MNIWVQKSRYQLKANRKGWHCKEYLDGTKVPVTERYLAGGRGSTSNPQSMAFIRKVRPGDLIVLHQSDDETFHAFTIADSEGFESTTGSRKFDSYYLKPANTAFRFANPFTLTQLRAAGCNPDCFGPQTTGRLFPLTVEDFVLFIKVAAATNPDQAKALSAWLRERS